MREKRVTPVRSAILLNRCVARAHSTADARQVLEGLGYQVLATAVPRLEVYAQSSGQPLKQAGLDIWHQAARDLIARALRPTRCGERQGPEMAMGITRCQHALSAAYFHLTAH